MYKMTCANYAEGRAKLLYIWPSLRNLPVEEPAFIEEPNPPVMPWDNLEKYVERVDYPQIESTKAEVYMELCCV